MVPDEIHLAREHAVWIPLAPPRLEDELTPSAVDLLHDLIDLILLAGEQGLPLREDGQPSAAALKALARRLHPQEVTKGALGLARPRFVIALGRRLALLRAQGGRLLADPWATTWFEQGPAACWLAVWELQRELAAIASSAGSRAPSDAGALQAFFVASLDQLRYWPDDRPITARALVDDDGQAERLKWVLTHLLRPLGILVPNLEDRDEDGQPPWALTPTGAWLLGRSDGTVPDGYGTLALGPDTRLEFAGPGPPFGLLQLQSWIEWDEAARCHRFTQRSIARGLARRAVLDSVASRSGVEPAERRAAWLAGIEARLTAGSDAAAGRQLRQWMQEASVARVVAREVLESEAEVRARLLEEPRLRRWVAADLGSAGLLLQPGGAAGMIDVLARTNIAVANCSGSRDASRQVEHDAHVVAGLLLMASLADQLNMPAEEILSALAGYGEAPRAAGEQIAARVLANLRATRAPGEASTLTSDQAKQQAIDAAIRTEGALYMGYWSRREGRLLERVVEPRERHTAADHEYLHAFCRLRGAERTFRLDHIVWLRRC
ncbi:MAG: hypothetical protein KDI55_25690, partial [Anaerolineae bacterium]|nr:hypothetical protein [Anaerolineae bacterium]